MFLWRYSLDVFSPKMLESPGPHVCAGDFLVRLVLQGEEMDGFGRCFGQEPYKQQGFLGAQVLSKIIPEPFKKVQPVGHRARQWSCFEETCGNREENQNLKPQNLKHCIESPIDNPKLHLKVSKTIEPPKIIFENPHRKSKISIWKSNNL